MLDLTLLSCNGIITISSISVTSAAVIALSFYFFEN